MARKLVGPAMLFIVFFGKLSRTSAALATRMEQIESSTSACKDTIREQERRRL
jgi:hypothetical protein